jgi:hypothetical protein
MIGENIIQTALKMLRRKNSLFLISLFFIVHPHENPVTSKRTGECSHQALTSVGIETTT